MPDLRSAAVSDWLHLMQPVKPADDWPPAMRPLETSSQAEMLLAEFGHLLDREAEASPTALAVALHSPALILDFQEILAQLGAARPLRILHWLQEQDLPDSLEIAAGLIAGDRHAARALRETIATLLRRTTLSRVTAPERLAELQIAAETALKESA
jgi:hypothetical protein